MGMFNIGGMGLLNLASCKLKYMWNTHRLYLMLLGKPSVSHILLYIYLRVLGGAVGVIND